MATPNRDDSSGELSFGFSTSWMRALRRRVEFD